MAPREIPVRSAEEWDADIGGMMTRHEAGDLRLAEFRAEVRSLALLFQQGDARAIRRLGAVNEEMATLSASQDLLQVAIEEAGEHRRAAADRERVAVLEVNRLEAAAVAQDLLEASGEADAALRAVAAALGRRDLLARKLHGLGYRGDSGLFSSSRILRAGWAAGLGRHLVLQPVDQRH